MKSTSGYLSFSQKKPSFAILKLIKKIFTIADYFMNYTTCFNKNTADVF